MNRISGRLSLVFVCFFLLVLVSAGATAWGLQAQSSDALAINLAGRQRMLIQWMTRLAVAPDRSPEEMSALAAASRAFDQTMQAFISGGTVEYPTGQSAAIPAASDPDVRAQLDRLNTGWQNYRTRLAVIQSTAPDDPVNISGKAAIQAAAPSLLAEADHLVRLYQQGANRRIISLGWIQAGFFGGATLLLLAGVWVVARSILQPLKALESAAARIGTGDLDTPVRVTGPQEIDVLATAVDSMRRGLQSSRTEMMKWNQTLETRVAERTRELNALSEVSREIASRLEPDLVFQSVVDKTRALLNADAAYLCLLDDDGVNMNLSALSGLDELVRSPATSAGNRFVASILTNRCAQGCGPDTCQGACGVINDQLRRSHLAASLWAENRVIGALCVGKCTDDGFSAEALQLLTRLAGAAAVAIENARLYRQAERLAALEERQRIAAEMHDGLAQTIDSLGMLIDRAEEQLEHGAAEQAGRMLDQAYDRARLASSEVRRTIAGLQDEPLRPADLQERLRRLLDRLIAENDAPVEWQIDLPGKLYLREADAEHVVGVAQEALVNARRYSGASKISLRLVEASGSATLWIEDNGCGFDPRQPAGGDRLHFGLKILQARAAQLGGQLEVTSARGCGTTIELTWPVRRTPAAERSPISDE